MPSSLLLKFISSYFLIQESLFKNEPSIIDRVTRSLQTQYHHRLQMQVSEIWRKQPDAVVTQKRAPFLIKHFLIKLLESLVKSFTRTVIRLSGFCERFARLIMF